MKLRRALFVADAKYKKQKKYAEDDSDLEEDAVVEHYEHWQCNAREIERAEKMFSKENEKLVRRRMTRTDSARG
jgi:DNA topoisomerase-1